MIIKDNIEFHAAELRSVPGGNGVTLSRFPQTIANTINERGRFVTRDSVNTEIRFVCDAPRIYLYLGAEKPEFGTETLPIYIFRGNFEQKMEWLEEGKITRVVIDRADMTKVKPEALRKGPGIGFSPDVIRIIPDRSSLYFYGIDTFGHEIRPPKPEEKPAKTCLFYGSSITNSKGEGYPATAARILGMDFHNMGLSGACHMETNLIDWMVEQQWDLATLELGINVLWMEPEEFHKRAEYTVKKFTETGKPVFLMTIFPCYCTYDDGKAEKDTDHFNKFNEILRKLSKKYNRAGNLHLIEGADILSDYCGLSTDFVHPKGYGHFLMGYNLADKIAKILG